MATIPMQRDIGVRRGRWLTAGIVLIILVIGIALVVNTMSVRTAAPTLSTTTVAPGSIVATVAGSGAIAAAQTLNLGFKTAGSVTDVLVKEGDMATIGQPLARLDTRDLELKVASAQAQLDSARVKLAQVQNGDVRPTEISAQQAMIASAEAQVRSAQAQLAALKNPTPDQISAAQTNVRQAELTLQSQRNNSSATKTKAEQDLQKAAEALTQAQSKYSTALQNWSYVQDTGNDPSNPTVTNAQGKEVGNKLSDTQRQQYYDTFIQAQAALRSAEAAVVQAQISYDNARQAEPNTIQQSEATLANAQAQLAALKNPSKNTIAQRQASVDQAQATLAQAQANLQKLSAGGTANEIAIQQASVTQAEVALAQARLALEQMTLVSPFNGVVTAVTIVPGSNVSTAANAISLIDRSTLHVDLKLSENDVAAVHLGQPVDLVIDALKDWSAQGIVSYIAPSSESSNGVVTYAVRVSFPDSDPRVKVGMTANLVITTSKKDQVLLVPNSALLPKGAERVVQVLNADGTIREVEVQTGLSDGSNMEITSGLKAGDKVVTVPTTSTTAPRTGFFGIGR